MEIIKASDFDIDQNDTSTDPSIAISETSEMENSQVESPPVAIDRQVNEGSEELVVEVAHLRTLVVGELTPVEGNIDAVEVINVETITSPSSDGDLDTHRQQEEDQQSNDDSSSLPKLSAKELDIHPVPNICDNGYCFLYSPEQLRHGTTGFEGAHAHVKFYFWTIDGIMYFHALALPFCLGVPIVQDDDPIMGKSQASPLQCLYDTYSARWGCLKYYLATAADVGEGRPLDMARFLMHVTDHEDHTVVQQQQQSGSGVQQQVLRPLPPDESHQLTNSQIGDTLPVATQLSSAAAEVDTERAEDDAPTAVAVSESSTANPSLVYIQVCKVRHPIRRTEPNFRLDKSRIWEFVLC